MKTKVIVLGVAIFVFVLLGMKLVFHEHEYGKWYVSVAATEETTGLQTRKCEKCGDIEEQIIPMLIHVHDNDSEITKEPTCVSTGILTATCKTCGVVQELEIDMDKEGHKYSEWEELSDKLTNTTVTKKRICSLCGNVEERVHTHDYDNWVTIKQETCLAGGEIEAQCIYCSYVQNEKVPVGDHKYTDWNVHEVPTCLSGGAAERHCIYCQLSETLDLPVDKDGHKYSEWEIIVKETLTTEGLRRRKCSLCKYVHEEVIPVHQHTMSEWEALVPSTCSKGGTAKRHCLGCDYSETTNLNPDSSLHQFELDWTSKPGYVLDKCKVCGHVQAEYADKPNKD